jgi:DNA polymerase III epsilon subunit-like protein
MSFIVVDVETDGPIPGKYSMVSFGAVVLEETLSRTFYRKLKPISAEWIPEALAVSGFSREQHDTFDNPVDVMRQFHNWLNTNAVGRPVFISDNVAFDWQWINYYFHFFVGSNPFGFSGRRIGDLYCGMKMDTGLNNEWKRRLRKTKHDHHPVNDAMGNAEALLEMKKMGLKIPTHEKRSDRS